jgi:hypothetical protein
MTNNTTHTPKDYLIRSVYAAVPEALHEHVEHALLYHGADLENGNDTMEEFILHVRAIADINEVENAQNKRNHELLVGVRQLLAANKIEHEGFAQELLEQLEEGDSSLLARFIALQPVISPLDAAVSFLAWKHARALAEIEVVFGVDLSSIRGLQAEELLDTSESMMSMTNLSVLSR